MKLRCAFNQVYLTRARLGHHSLKTTASHIARWEHCSDDPEVERIGTDTFDLFRERAGAQYRPAVAA